MTRAGAYCFVQWVDDPAPLPLSVFVAFGSYDDETATDAERELDRDVFYYVDGLAEFRELVANGSIDFRVTDVIEIVGVES